jgi:anti-sigma B factor antagonist
MDASPLTTSVETGGDVARVTLAGRIDRDADAALAAAYESARRAGATRIRLDFDGVDYINSTGIALIVRLLAEARRDGREVIVAGLTEHYREIFRITRLADYMTIEAETSPRAATAGAREGA